MVEFTEYSGAMARWPRVEAVGHSHETLQQLRAEDWRAALATNAIHSDEGDIRAALERVGLDGYIFDFIQRDLGMKASQLVMVGDNYAVDVEGANRCGIRAVWYRPGHEKLEGAADWQTIGDLAELPRLLQIWPEQP